MSAAREALGAKLTAAVAVLNRHLAELVASSCMLTRPAPAQRAAHMPIVLVRDLSWVRPLAVATAELESLHRNLGASTVPSVLVVLREIEELLCGEGVSEFRGAYTRVRRVRDAVNASHGEVVGACTECIGLAETMQ